MDTIRKHLHETVEAFKEAMVVKNCPTAKALPELLNFIATRFEIVLGADPRVSELRTAAGLLEKAQIIAAGGTPIMRVCQFCKIAFGAKEGGEAYPEEMRRSHGCCPTCARIHGIIPKDCPICHKPARKEFAAYGDEFCSKDCLDGAGRQLDSFGS
jgi:hypothetical protein